MKDSCWSTTMLSKPVKSFQVLFINVRPRATCASEKSPGGRARGYRVLKDINLKGHSLHQCYTRVRETLKHLFLPEHSNYFRHNMNYFWHIFSSYFCLLITLIHLGHRNMEHTVKADVTIAGRRVVSWDLSRWTEMQSGQDSLTLVVKVATAGIPLPWNPMCVLDTLR